MLKMNPLKKNIMGIKFLIDRALDNVMNNAIRHAPEFSK